jgi:hypothetical protein
VDNVEGLLGAVECEKRTVSRGRTLPYVHLNLRANPFGRLTRLEKNALLVRRIELDPYVERLGSPGYAVQLSHEGAPGKTTHLLAIRRHFPKAPYVFVKKIAPPPEIPEAPVLFIDRFHAIPRKLRVVILRRPGSFAIVSHAHHIREYKMAGLNFDVVKMPCYSPAKLKEYVDKRIGFYQRKPEQPVPTVSQEILVKLLTRFGNDINVIAYLYEVFEKLEEVGDVEILD